ncbi:FliH/SctL family protein [Helicobacter kayseriensis]|uniref:FliH/SctL family protein n=1 Tax=Helicobacter kayseriensis TaxID=2905877 RepID=UPI001E31F9F4|nr:FliH/SctL family protein [Helicobacter kayseriensis]MCE3046849.1 hypothetical protein [Helicobacter kayseriensis]MCE3047849.1 hypothetical protein [Helicobacter kayseriensis]
MSLLNSIEGNNFITEKDHTKHVIKKYEFRSIDKKLEAEIAPSMEESGIYTPSHPEHQKVEGLENLQEQLNKTLEENQKIFQKLEFLQEFLQKQNQIDPAMLDEIKSASYQQGKLEGENKAKEELQAEIDSQKEKMILAIDQLEKNALLFQEQVQKIRDDLSVIALDLAKEVILKEVTQESSKIAFLIAEELLKPLEKSAHIILKAHPLDCAYLEEKLSSMKNLKIESDLLVGRGGVIVSSADGHFDGSISARYKNLKRSILDIGDYE